MNYDKTIFEKIFVRTFYDNLIFRDDWYFWSNEGTKLKLKTWGLSWSNFGTCLNLIKRLLTFKGTQSSLRLRRFRTGSNKRWKSFSWKIRRPFGLRQYHLPTATSHGWAPDTEKPPLCISRWWIKSKICRADTGQSFLKR